MSNSETLGLEDFPSSWEITDDNEMSIILIDRSHFFEIFMVERNLPEAIAEEFYNFYSARDWCCPCGKGLVDRFAAARDWLPSDDVKRFLPSMLHQKWSRIYYEFKKKVGMHEALDFLMATPKLNAGVLDLWCSLQIKDVFEENIGFLKSIIRKEFGEEIKLQYRIINP